MSSLMHVYMEFERILFWHVSFWWSFELPQMRPKWGCHSLILGFGECHHRILRVEYSLATYLIFIFGVLSKTINRRRGVKGVFRKSWILQWKVIFHGYFAVRLDSPRTGDEPALLLEGFLHVSNIPTNKVCRLTDFATGPRPVRFYLTLSVFFSDKQREGA